MLKRFVHTKHLADKWEKFGYKIVAMAQIGNYRTFTYLMENFFLPLSHLLVLVAFKLLPLV